MIPEDTTYPVRLRKEKFVFAVKRGERNEGWPGTEWLMCVAQPFDDARDPFQMTSLVRAPYWFRAQTTCDLRHEPIDVRPMVEPSPLTTIQASER